MVKMSIKVWFIFIFALLFIALAACASPQNTIPPVAEPQKILLSIGTDTAPSDWEKEWQQVLTAARKEGKVVYYSSLGGEARQMVSNAFMEKYGIPVEVTSGRGPELAEKITSERKAGLYAVDVSTSGSTTTILIMKPRGQLVPIPPALILPEVKDPKAWWRGDLDWGDKDKTIVNFSAYPTPPLAINTDIVGKDEIKSYRDLLNPKWKGKISLNDPTVPGVGSKIIGTIGEKIMGMDFLRELVKQEPFITRDHRLQIEWLAHGKYPVALSPDSPTLIEFRRLGAPVLDFTPIEGTYLTSGYGVGVLLDRPPHPNAAKVFFNWLLSKDGGLVFSKATNAQSGRVDVPTDHLDQYRVRKPGMIYVEAYSEEYTLKEPDNMQTAKDLFGHLMK